MSKPNSHLIVEILDEITRLGRAWRDNGLTDSAIAAEVIIDALTQKFLKGALRETIISATTYGTLLNTLIYTRNVLDSQDKSDEELKACKQIDEAIALIEEKTR